MKRVVSILAWLLFTLHLAADSVVVFNEVHYHPEQEEPRYEWIELKNQLSVDVDLSGWSIQNDVRFTFPEGSIIRGRDYLVIALDPVSLKSTTQRTNILGPFEGRLANDRGHLTLRNNTQRLMDELHYASTAPWPSSPDGHGPSLARRSGFPAPDRPTSWQESSQNGGSPGAENFPTPPPRFETNAWMQLNQAWRYYKDPGAPAAEWSAANYDDSAWSSGVGPFQAGGPALPFPVGTELPNNAPTRYFRTTFNAPSTAGSVRLTLDGLIHDGAVGYLNGVEAFRYNMPSGIILPSTPARSDSASTDVLQPIAIPSELVRPGPNVLAVEVHQGLRPTGYSLAVMTSAPVAYWRQNETNGISPDASSLSGLQDGVFSGLGATNRLSPGPRPTDLIGGRPLLGFPTNNLATRFAGNTEGGNDVMTVVDPGVFNFQDGQAFTIEAWINGPTNQESGAAIFTKGTGGGGEQYALDIVSGKFRLFTRDASGTAAVSALNAPDGPTGSWQHLAAVIDPPSGVMRLYVNGVERASAAVSRTLLPTSHELSVGARQLASSAYDLNFNGRIDDIAVYRRALPPAEIQTHFNAAFEPSVPDTVDTNELAMGIALSSYSRLPEPEPPTIPATTPPSPQSGIVINEIHYNPKPQLPMAATYSNAVLITFSNLWQHHTRGVDLGTAWRQSEVNDGGWQQSPAPFYAPSGLSIPLPKQTSLSLSNAGGQKISTFYFRTQFNIAGPTNGIRLSLRTLLDDGAVFYLNNVEILRLGMPAGDIAYTNAASTNVNVMSLSAARVLNVSNLVSGLNTLAVEVHQSTAAAADMAFATELTVIHQLTPEIAFQDRPGAWVELFNRTQQPIDLGHCSLSGGISFEFPLGQIIPPAGFLVVAQNPSYLKALHPGVPIVGPFGGRLSHGGECLELLDAQGLLMDEVCYHDDGYWPATADGGGSSLELRNPDTDNSNPDNWAASAETNRSEWKTYRWRGVSKPGQLSEPDLWHELEFCLIEGGGEVLIDDVSVIENPAGTSKQLMWNGTFDNGSARYWRFMGTHRHSEVIRDPENTNNWVLRLVSNGPGEYQGNQVESTFTNNLAVVDGREYEISFKARWISGASLLNTRIYFNRLARTTALPIREGGGTPGAQNSRYTPRIGPSFSALSHFPVAPDPGEPVRIRVHATDPQGLGDGILHYRRSTNAWQIVPMTSPVPGLFEAFIPGFAAGSVVQFYVEAFDAEGTASFSPAAGTNSRALYVVNDGQVLPPPIHSVRVLMPPSDAVFLHAETNTLSNELLGATVIEDNEHVYYDVGVRLKGSFVGRNVARVGFHLEFGSEKPFRGVHPIVSVDKAFHVLIGNVSELLVKQVAAHAGGVATMNDDIAYFIAPLPQFTSMSTLRLSGFDSAWLDAQYPNGSAGRVHEIEVLRWNVATIDGKPEGLKQVGNESGGTGFANLEVMDYGDDKESYRWFTLASNHRDEDDFTGVMNWCKTLSLVSTNLDQRSKQTMDVDQWLRTLAYQTLVGPGDAYFTGGNIHNFRVYVRPDDGRVLYLPWDWDSSFQISTTSDLIGSGNIANLVNIPNNRRIFLNHVYDIVSTTFNKNYMARWIKHYGEISRTDLSAADTYITGRSAYALTQLPLNTPFAITNNAGADFATSTNQLILAGTAPISVRSIELNGTVYPITWIANTAWRLSIPLNAGANSLSVQGISANGQRIPTALDTITITNNGPSALRPVVINEWMADNASPGGLPDPADGLFQDWFELFNPNPVSVDLSNYTLTDDLTRPTKWKVPAGKRIAAGGYLLVWADNQTQQNTPDETGALHAAFQLNNGGEAIGLYAPNGVLQHAVRFGTQSQNISQGLFPDGATNHIVWMLAPSPGTLNRLGNQGAPLLLEFKIAANHEVQLSFTTLPALSYWVEHSPSLSEPQWQRVGAAVVANGSTATLNLGPADSPAGFYRVHLETDVQP